jgi:citrate lyase subunit beta/citryl-CoA lyase
MRLRSLLRATPGDSLAAALESDADAVLLALTDETRPIDELRAAVAEAVEATAQAGKTPLVAVNHPRTQLTRGDLEAITGPRLAGVLLPHCTEPQDVRDTAVLLREFEHTRDIEPGQVTLFPVIDTARGLLRAAESLTAAPRTAGLVLASEPFARDVGARLEESGPRLAYARGSVVAAAAAHEGVALIDGSTLELRDMANYGFAGAVLDDARLVPVANDVFEPTASAIKRARADLEAYESRPEGSWVARRDGRVVDAPRARQAKRTLDRASDGA